MILWDWLVLLLIVLGSAICYGSWLNGHFRRKGVKYIESTLPFFGHMWKIFLGREHFIQAVYKTYNTYSDQKYVGFYAFWNKIIILRDLDLIKRVGVKDFDHFIDHRVFMDEDSDPLFGKNLFFLRGQKWRDMRMAMSPAYTGSKMKNMFPMIIECAEQTVEHFCSLAQLPSVKEVGYVAVEMKDVFTRYTNDVISSTAFGLKVNSLKDPTNEFYMMGKRATNFSGVQFLKFLGYGSFPGLMKFFKITLFPKPVASFFRNLIKDTMESREQEGSIRPDMIHLLMLAKKGSLKFDTDSSQSDNTGYATIHENNIKQETMKRELTNDDLTAQAMAFLLAGFDTSSSLLCFVAYELSLNPEIQKKLQREIHDIISKNHGQKLSYVDLIKMKYIDMVVTETLRKWPPDGHLDRLCADSYTLPPPDNLSNKSYKLNKGDDVWIPTYSIHHDANYYPNPETFNPERFSDENKSLIQPFTFIPFGIGPRFCVGARFAVLEVKVILFHLLVHFDFVTTPNTTIPLKLATNTFIMHSENGFHLGLKLRNKQ